MTKPEETRGGEAIAGQTCTTDFIAKLFMITERRVQQLTKEKILPQIARGQYDLMSTIQAFIRYLNERIKNGDDADLLKERALLTKAQRETAELELAVMRGELHKCDDVMRVWTENVVNCRSRLLAVPTKVAPILAEIGDAQNIQAILKEAINEALDELTDYNKGRISNMEIMGEV
jgi:phage terminase Nu1 subunit (DNA packaging protein)